MPGLDDASSFLELGLIKGRTSAVIRGAEILNGLPYRIGWSKDGKRVYAYISQISSVAEVPIDGGSIRVFP